MVEYELPLKSNSNVTLSIAVIFNLIMAGNTCEIIDIDSHVTPVQLRLLEFFFLFEVL